MNPYRGQFAIGLDLGRMRDFSAIAVVERLVRPTGEQQERHRRIQGSSFWGGDQVQTYAEPVLEDVWQVRHLQRFARGTTFSTVVEELGVLMRSDALRDRCVLRFDRTGVGIGVEELLEQAYRDGRLGSSWPEGITLTSGQQAHGLSVPKADLVSRLAVLFEQGRLQIAKEMQLADVLQRELTGFNIRLTPSGASTWGSATESLHDDLTMAVAYACYSPPRLSEPAWIDADGRVQRDLSR